MASHFPSATTSMLVPRSKIAALCTEVLDLDPNIVEWISINASHISANLSVPLGEEVMGAALAGLKKKHPRLTIRGDMQRIETQVIFHFDEEA